MKYKTKSVVIGRMPRKGNNEFKTAFIKLFDENDAHKTSKMPTKEFEYPNIEKVVINKKGINYFLEGNDIVLNDVGEISVEKKGNVIVVE